MEVLLNLLSAKNCDWATSPRILPVLEPILMRLCARYVHSWRCNGQFKLTNVLSSVGTSCRRRREEKL